MDQANDERFYGVRDMIRSGLVETGAPSLAVAVAQNGEILWEEGFGWANREERIPADAHTVYSLASISKPITATGLMVLKERGKIDLDSPINEYLGEAKMKAWAGKADDATVHLGEAKMKAWAGKADDATVRRAANHSSGLPLHYHFFCEDEPYPRPSMDETIRRYANIVTPPGEKYQYSNLGYGILDYVISRLSGGNYRDFMREEVFLPLGMTRASVHVGPGLKDYHAVRYGGDGLPIPFYDFDHRGASAVFSSAHDLARFGMFHLKAHLPDQKEILSHETIDEMQLPTVDVGDGGYGVGWRISQNNMGYLSVSHSGGMGGVATTLVLIPQEKIAVVSLANSSSSLPHQICREILSAMLPEYAKNRAISEAKADENQKSASPFKPTRKLIGEWSGSVHAYKEEIPVTFWFKKSGDVHVRMGNQLTTLLNNVAYRQGHLSGRMMGDIGTEDANRRLYHLHVSLKLRGQALNGAMTAISLPGQKMGNALSCWMNIRKQ